MKFNIYCIFLLIVDDDHYKDFSEVYGTDTTEEFCPSAMKKAATKITGTAIPFSPSAQTTKTVKMTINCIDCDKPRVIYSASKLNNEKLALLQRILSLYQYSCGSCLQELKTDDITRAPTVNALLDEVYVRGNITCDTNIEVPYYSSGCFLDICYYCAIDSGLIREAGQYPVCQACTAKSALFKRKRNVANKKQKS